VKACIHQHVLAVGRVVRVSCMYARIHISSFYRELHPLPDLLRVCVSVWECPISADVDLFIVPFVMVTNGAHAKLIFFERCRLVSNDFRHGKYDVINAAITDIFNSSVSITMKILVCQMTV